MVVLLVAAVPAWAQSPHANSGKSATKASASAPKTLDVHFATEAKTSPAPASETNVSPEMTYRQQYQQAPTPTEIVLQRAAINADQRNQRLAAMKWFGYSNSRPRSGVDVNGGDQAPGWVSDNPAFPYQFSGYSTSQIVFTR